MDPAVIAHALTARRFDLEVPEALDILRALSRREASERRRALEKHYEQVETALDVLRDLFSLDAMPGGVRDELRRQLQLDADLSRSPMVRASMGACARLLAGSERS